MRDSHLSLRAIAWSSMSIFVWIVTWRELHNLWNAPSTNTTIVLSSTATVITFYTLSILKDEPLVFLWKERMRLSAIRTWRKAKDRRERKRVVRALTQRGGTYFNELNTVSNPFRNGKKNRKR